MLVISAVEKNSIGKELKLNKGDIITAFDGFDVMDELDYLYYDAQNSFTMTVKRKTGESQLFEIEKDDDESLGLNFENNGLDIKTCTNNCIFCFVAQMPKGMRESLYVKDDDYRQSFLCGNFVTLTNLTDKDVERIIRLHISPLYISVHTLNGELRKKMMNNRFADKITEYIDVFSKHGIQMQTQVVLVENVNDKAELDYTARGLYKYYPNVETMAVVPCGITKYRDGLTKIEDISKEYAKSVIDQANRLNKEFGQNFICLADEFYFKAGLPTEKYEFYGEFKQIENGVGATAKFVKELDDSLEKRTYNKKFLSVTGTSAYEFIKTCAKKVENYCQGVSIEVLAVKNEFFGETVNCAGLVVGKDIIGAVKKHGGDFDELVLPKCMLKETEDVFLDGVTLKELSKEINKPVRVSGYGGEGFFDVFTRDYKE